VELSNMTLLDARQRFNDVAATLAAAPPRQPRTGGRRPPEVLGISCQPIAIRGRMKCSALGHTVAMHPLQATSFKEPALI
jgi:hypothetical protein